MWKRNSWNLAVIFLFFLFSIVLVSAQNISLEYKDEITFGEEFDINIKLIDFQEDTYDVKIDIITNGERIAKIFDPNDDKYQSTYYFVSGLLDINENKDFKMNITTEYEGKADIIVKIRDSSGNSESFSGYNINIIVEEIETIKEEPEEDTIEQNEEVEKDEELKEEGDILANADNDDVNKINNTSKFIHTSNKVKKDVIFLTPQTIKNQRDKEVIFRSSNEKIKNYAIYGFAVFCVLVIVLLILDRR